jgi:ribose transport system substrate-binding protein
LFFDGRRARSRIDCRYRLPFIAYPDLGLAVHHGQNLLDGVQMHWRPAFEWTRLQVGPDLENTAYHLLRVSPIIVLAGARKRAPSKLVEDAVGCSSSKWYRAYIVAIMIVLNAGAVASAETIATFTRNPANPILRGVRIGSEIAARSLDAQTVHFIPRSESPAEQLGLIDEVVRNKPDAIVLAPFDPTAMMPAVDRLNGAGIPVTNVNERLAGGNIVAYVGTDDYQLALTTARYLINTMGKKGNIVMLEGPDNLPTSIARVKAYKDVLKEFPDVKLLASKSAQYARTPAAEVMKSFLRLYPQIDGVLAANDPMAIGAIESLKAANKKALVVGINASKEVVSFVKSGELLGSGDYNGFNQGCLGTQIAIRNLRKQPTPKEVILKAIVMDRSNYQDYETPIERRACPTLESATAN